jgi:predicted RNA-binding protein with PUA-like domain
MMRDGMRVGDLAFFYHSNCAEPGIVGVVKIVRAGYPDSTALDPESPYHDPKATSDNPRWYRVDVKFQKKFRQTIALSELKRHPQLEGMAVLAKGSRLSITPVTAAQWEFILSLS